MDERKDDVPEAIVRPYGVLLVVGVGTLLMAMAGSSVNLALPDLGRELNISIETSRWVIQAFLLAVGVLVLVAGRLSDLLGHRRVYLVGYVLFSLSSLACGLAGGFWLLVGLRVLQGVGGAMIMATGPALLTTSFPPGQRGRALGLLATATYLGLTAGPPLGGVIVAGLGWRWTFFVNVPVGFVVLVLGLWFLPRAVARRGAGFDWVGALCLCTGLPLVLMAVSMLPAWGAGAWQTHATLLPGVAALAGFLWLQRRSKAPLLDLGLFRSRVFTGAVVSALANYVALFAMILLLPFYLEEGLGYSPAIAGAVLGTHPAVMALVASPSGWLSDRLGSRGLATLGMAVLGLGLYGLSGLGAAGSHWTVAAWLGVVGLGTGIFISPNSSALMGAAPRDQQGTAGSVLAESRVLGMFMGVALATAIFGAMGGRTGSAWQASAFQAYRWALLAAVCAAVFGALAASLRGSKKQG